MLDLFALAETLQQPFNLDEFKRLDPNMVTAHAKSVLQKSLDEKPASRPKYRQAFCVFVLGEFSPRGKTHRRELGRYLEIAYPKADKLAQHEILLYAYNHRLPAFRDKFKMVIAKSLKHRGFFFLKSQPMLAALYFQRVRTKDAVPLLEKLEKKYQRDQDPVIIRSYPYDSIKIDWSITDPLTEVRKALAFNQ